jgi:hypothetical protein
MSNAYGVVLFESTSAALRAEKEVKEHGLKVKLIPVPRHLSSDCGICLRFEWPDMDKVKELFGRGDLKFEDIRQV